MILSCINLFFFNFELALIIMYALVLSFHGVK